jgi:hypothetical protein
MFKIPVFGLRCLTEVNDRSTQQATTVTGIISNRKTRAARWLGLAIGLAPGGTQAAKPATKAAQLAKT